ncbi:MAG: CBS domain-containing protein [Alphaproteobacteria bacterium]|nr:MAG: CBS domain-containing protein [Alphaproteobacteria bacterium]
MKIRELMSRDVQVVSPGALLQEVAKRMRKRDCGCVLVADNDRLVGMITDRDIAIRAAAELPHPAGMTADQVMSSEILYCCDTDEADAVARNMYLNKVRRLVVLDGQKHLVGVVSLGDITLPVPEQDSFSKLSLVCHPDLIPVMLPSVNHTKN